MNKLKTAAGAILLIAGSLAALAAADEASSSKGTWSVNNWIPGDEVHLTLAYRKATTRWQWGNDQQIDELHGLTRNQLRAAHADVDFTLKRDAGTFTFEGSFTLGIGRGSFRFEPDPTYASKLSALGYGPVDDDAASLMFMAVRDISLEYAAEVNNSGLKDVTLKDLTRLQDHGVELDFIRQLTVAGYTDLTTDDVVRFRDHGIDGDFLRALKATGRTDLKPDAIVKLHDHGIRPDYVARINSAGYGDLSVEQIIKLHDHGVD